MAVRRCLEIHPGSPAVISYKPIARDGGVGYLRSHQNTAHASSQTRPESTNSSPVLRLPPAVTDHNMNTKKKQDRRSGGQGKSCVTQYFGDLFDVEETVCLAHCVGSDFRMSQGIAAIFRQRFGSVGQLIDQRVDPGGVAYIKHQKRHIFYLVTKQKSSGKPTYESMERSLLALHEKCKQLNVSELAMPRIGCGLDRLDWGKVKNMLAEIFADGFVIRVYTLATEMGRTENPDQHYVNDFRGYQDRNDSHRDVHRREDLRRDDRHRVDLRHDDRHRADIRFDDRCREDLRPEDRHREDLRRDGRCRKDLRHDDHHREDLRRDDGSREDLRRDSRCRKDLRRDDLRPEDRHREDLRRDGRCRKDLRRDDLRRDGSCRKDLRRDDLRPDDRHRADIRRDDRCREDLRPEDRHRVDLRRHDRCCVHLCPDD